MLSRITDIRNAIENATDNDYVSIAPGTYEINTPLKLGADNITIYGNNAIINGSNSFSGDSILDWSGSRRSIVHSLRVEKSGGAACALKLGRTIAGDGSGHTFHNLNLIGAFTSAVVYSIAAEGCMFTSSCNFVTQNNKPCYLNSSADVDGLGLIEESNTLHWFYGCSFRNYSGLEGVAMIQLHNNTTGASFRDCYAYTGTNGIFIETCGTAQNNAIDQIRVEGEGAGSLFLSITAAGTYINKWNISGVNWTIASDYLIRAYNHILSCNLDFIGRINSTKIVELMAGAKVLRCYVKSDIPNWVTQTDGEVRSCHLSFIGGQPQQLTGTDDNITTWTA